MANRPQTIDGVVNRWGRRGFRFGQQQAEPEQQAEQDQASATPAKPALGFVQRPLPAVGRDGPLQDKIREDNEAMHRFATELAERAGVEPPPPPEDGAVITHIALGQAAIGQTLPASAPVRTPVAPEPGPSPAPGQGPDDRLGSGNDNPRAVAFRRQVAEELVEKIQSGTAPWQRPWDPEVGAHGMPRNAISGRPYHGMNSFILEMKSPDGDPRWLTYKQAADNGWQIKPGSKGTKIEYWQRVEKDPERAAGDGRDDTADGRDGGKDGRQRDSYLVHRTYTVFHASQVDGIPPLEQKPLPPEHERFERAEQVALAVGAPVLESTSGKAFYRERTDEIHMPPRAAFNEPGGYEAVLLHEAGHATGHESRLDRKLGNRFGSPDYAREELRAEMTSAILSRELGVPHDPGRHASYAASWAEAVKKDPNELFKAASEAQRIAGWMVDRARERGVEIDSGLGAPAKAVEPSRQVGQARSADRADGADRSPAETPVKVLGEDVRRWTGRVAEVAEDRTSVTMRAAGRDTIVRMPDGQTVPDGVAPGVYGKLAAGRDGTPARFDVTDKDKAKSRGRGGQGREVEL